MGRGHVGVRIHHHENVATKYTMLCVNERTQNFLFFYIQPSKFSNSSGLSVLRRRLPFSFPAGRPEDGFRRVWVSSRLRASSASAWTVASFWATVRGDDDVTDRGDWVCE